MPKTREVVWAEGVAFLGGLKLADTITVAINDELKIVRHLLGDGGGEITWATGRKVTGIVTFNGIDADLLAEITGGTKTAGTKTRVRLGEESAIVFDDEGIPNGSPYKIDLVHGTDVVPDSIEVYDENGIHYKKVIGNPFPYEFYYKSGDLKFNSQAVGLMMYPAYLYDDSGVGNTITIKKSDLPSRMELWCMLRARNLAEISTEYLNRDIIIHLAKVNRTGALTVGAEDRENTSSWSFEFMAELMEDGDMEVYFPKKRIRTAILIVDYAGNNICDYNGELIGMGYTEDWG